MAKTAWRNDILMAVLGVFSIAIVYWADAPNTSRQTWIILAIVDAALVLWFVLDWIEGFRRSPDRRAYFMRQSWRLLGMIPLVVIGLEFLRILRLARVIHVLDRIPPVRRGLARLRGRLESADLVPLALAATSVTMIGAVLVWLAERGHNPRFEELSEAIWWAVVTVTTVGYGDITPITRIGRGVAVVLMITGIGTIGLLASQVGSSLVSKHRSQSVENLDERLDNLAKLHREGDLTDAEFAAAKNKVLR